MGPEVSLTLQDSMSSHFEFEIPQAIGIGGQEKGVEWKLI